MTINEQIRLEIKSDVARNIGKDRRYDDCVEYFKNNQATPNTFGKFINSRLRNTAHSVPYKEGGFVRFIDHKAKQVCITLNHNVEDRTRLMTWTSYAKIFIEIIEEESGE